MGRRKGDVCVCVCVCEVVAGDRTIGGDVIKAGLRSQQHFVSERKAKKTHINRHRGIAKGRK